MTDEIPITDDNLPEDENQSKNFEDGNRLGKSRQRFLGSVQNISGSVKGQGRRVVRTVGKTTQDIQMRIGEDYYAILDHHPLMQETLEREVFLYDKRYDILSTIFNDQWKGVAFWGAVSGETVYLQRPMIEMTNVFFHEGPGHVKMWDAINKFMDSQVGGGHRLKFGHSIEYLPQIVENYGIQGIPAYMMHMLQDICSPAGIPIIPNAWNVKLWLQNTAGFAPKTATSLVSLNFSGLMTRFVIWHFAQSLIKTIEAPKKVIDYLYNAQDAHEHQDYLGTVENYRRALEIKRTPSILMQLGEVYMQRATNRLKAHQAFTEALNLLAPEKQPTIEAYNAKLSLRGFVGMRALATADVLADINPVHWNEHIQDLVNATIYSFHSTANTLQDRTLWGAATPPYLSAAINYFLAAKAAINYPLLEERRDRVLYNLKRALECLGLVSQYNETMLRPTIQSVQHLWSLELLTPDEIEVELATYLPPFE